MKKDISTNPFDSVYLDKASLQRLSADERAFLDGFRAAVEELASLSQGDRFSYDLSLDPALPLSVRDMIRDLRHQAIHYCLTNLTGSWYDMLVHFEDTAHADPTRPADGSSHLSGTWAIPEPPDSDSHSKEEDDDENLEEFTPPPFGC